MNIDIGWIASHTGLINCGLQSADSVDTFPHRIVAIYYHARITGENQHHAKCASGESSWWWVKRADAKGKTPAPHSQQVMAEVLEGEACLPSEGSTCAADTTLQHNRT